MLESCDWESKIALEKFNSVFGNGTVNKVKGDTGLNRLLVSHWN